MMHIRIRTSRGAAVALLAMLGLVLLPVADAIANKKVATGDGSIVAEEAVDAIAQGRRTEAAAEPQEIAAGTFLVARRNLPDPNFSKTVVLLLRHNENGTSGLIINRPGEIKISSLLPEIEDPGRRRDIVYEGGPVSRDRVVMLLRSKARIEESRRIFDDVHASRSDELLKRLIRTRGEEISFRVYSGHAGWAPGQLAAELERGDWHVRDGDADVVFDESPHEIWNLLLPRDPSQSAELAPSAPAGKPGLEIAAIGPDWRRRFAASPE